MKKLVLVASIFLSSTTFASTTNLMRTPSGDLVRIGDTEASLIEKMGRPQPKFYVLNDGKLHCAATEYTYKIDFQEYKVINCRGRVVKIEWRNV